MKSADETQIVLTQIVVEREGKKKIKKVPVETPIPYEQIEKAVVKLSLLMPSFIIYHSSFIIK
jgi:hypothetical protein